MSVKEKLLTSTNVLICSLGIATSLFGILSCETKNSSETTMKFSESDVFASTMVKSQFFLLKLEEDQVIEGEKGTRIIFPEGCVIDDKGNIVTSDVEVELAEALNFSDMVLSNLTTTSEGEFLETGGMLYFNLTSGGKQLFINPEIPVYFEIPTSKRVSGMEVYHGERDSHGNMNWIDPEPLNNYLIPVDINLLDFLPAGFASEVGKRMPFRGHQVADQSLIDSLYYSLSISDGRDLIQGFIDTTVNEDFYSSEDSQIDSLAFGDETDHAVEDDCGVDPAFLKVLKNKRFENSFVATREFEKRLQTIFESCDNSVLELYLNNLDMDLWMSDSMAVDFVSDDATKLQFASYAKERLTNVQDGDVYAKILRQFLDEQLEKVKSELDNLHQEMKVTLEKENKVAEETVQRYKKVLEKREAHRMEFYGFQRTRTGWVNIDIGIVPKDWGPKKLELFVENDDSFDRVHVYIVFHSMKSLFRLLTHDHQHFYVGNEETKTMLMPNESEASCIAIAYRNSNPFIAVNEFTTGQSELLTTRLHETSFQEIEKFLSRFDGFSEENNIKNDLEYMAQFDKEKRRQEKLKYESRFIAELHDFVFACCREEGVVLFERNCGNCHTSSVYTHEDFRDLGGIGELYSKEWFIDWTRDGYKLYLSGDPKAKEIFDKYSSAYGWHVRPSLTDAEIRDIYAYLNSINN